MNICLKELSLHNNNITIKVVNNDINNIYQILVKYYIDGKHIKDKIIKIKTKNILIIQQLHEIAKIIKPDNYWQLPDWICN